MTVALGASRRILVVSPLLFCLVFSGCGEKKSASGKAEGETNMLNLMKLVREYRSQNNSQMPANDAAFKKFAEGLKPAKLAELGIEDVNKVFISPRDNQPYVILYNSGAYNDPMKAAKGDPSKAGRGGPPVLAYEKTGSGGKRYIALAVGGSVIEVDELTFKNYVPNP